MGMLSWSTTYLVSVAAISGIREAAHRMARTRRIAIVCQPWDNVAPQSGSSIVIIAYQLARRLAGNSYVTIYGWRGPGLKKSAVDGDTIRFKRLRVLQIPQGLVEICFGIIACYLKKRNNYMFSYFYHPFYALRVALSIRVSKCDIFIVHNFLQFASIIKLFNPSVKICLSMHCEWLTQFATPASECRLRKVDLIIGCSNYTGGRGAVSYRIRRGRHRPLLPDAEFSPVERRNRASFIYWTTITGKGSSRADPSI